MLLFGLSSGFLLGLPGGCAHLAGFEEPEEGDFPVWVVGHGWHTGIVLPAERISDPSFPALDDFAGFRYLEFGWGDEQFYRAGGRSVGLGIRALFWPTESVLHVAGFQGEPAEYFAASRVLRLDLDPGRWTALVEFLSDTFSRDEAGAPEILGFGLYGESRFYRARGNYIFPETCNVWTARALGAAGCRVRPFLAMTTGGLMRQALRCGARPTLREDRTSGGRSEANPGREAEAPRRSAAARLPLPGSVGIGPGVGPGLYRV